ncbi:MAG: hypothetical protein H6740_23325 [Alphaproteobacteria bacterium]|nr:hypothetical protein [Alphaproteobacteria bacterium]
MRALSVTLILGLLAACGEKEPVDSAADADGDGYPADVDCDDDDAAVNPGATEICDGVDNNCDDVVDEGLLITVYGDQDGDGFGVDAQAQEACAVEAGQAERGGDCDDSRADIHPGAPEEDCTDPVDYDCDGAVEYSDGDGDGYAACVDCDDGDGEVNPDADQLCDGVDNNCDGEVDEATAIDTRTFYADLDMDGYGDVDNTTLACAAPSGFVEDATDCDDDADTVHPGAEEICDAVDSDCDGVIGEVRVPTDHTTIQRAIDAGEAVICVEAGSYYESLEVQTDADFTLEGVGADQVFLDGGHTDRVLSVAGGDGAMTLRNLSVKDGFGGDGFAGGLRYEGNGVGTLRVEDVVFTGNVCEAELCYGGALYADDYDSAELWDVEVLDGTLYGAPYGVVTLFDGATTTLEGVSIHDNTVDSSSTYLGQASALLVRSYAADSSTGFLSSVLSVNGLEVNDNTSVSVGTMYAAATLSGLGTLDVSNASVSGNSTTTNGFCVAPGLFPYIVRDASYRNVEILGNDCTAGTNVYTGGFWHYGVGSDQAATGDVENMIVAGNTVSADRLVYSAWMFDYQSTTTYTNVSVHGNVATGQSNHAGWLLFGDTQVTLTNVDLSGNSLSSSAAPDYATGFGASDATSALTITYSNLAELGATPFSAELTDPRGADGVISEDPGYADVSGADPRSWDLHPGSGSALIDAGDPSLYDADGSTSDIGAYGGPYGANW